MYERQNCLNDTRPNKIVTRHIIVFTSLAAGVYIVFAARLQLEI